MDFDRFWAIFGDFWVFLMKFGRFFCIFGVVFDKILEIFGQFLSFLGFWLGFYIENFVNIHKYRQMYIYIYNEFEKAIKPVFPIKNA
jgi:hypothetical protein